MIQGAVHAPSLSAIDHEAAVCNNHSRRSNAPGRLDAGGQFRPARGLLSWALSDASMPNATGGLPRGNPCHSREHGVIGAAVRVHHNRQPQPRPSWGTPKTGATRSAPIVVLI